MIYIRYTIKYYYMYFAIRSEWDEDESLSFYVSFNMLYLLPSYYNLIFFWNIFVFVRFFFSFVCANIKRQTHRLQIGQQPLKVILKWKRMPGNRLLCNVYIDKKWFIDVFKINGKTKFFFDFFRFSRNSIQNVYLYTSVTGL